MAITDGPVRGPYPVTRPRDIEDRARPGAGECAVVLLGAELQPLPKGEVPTSGIGWFRPKSQYWIVDMRERSTAFEVTLDSADKGLCFHGSIEVDWRVCNARLAAEQAPFDVQRMLKRRIVPPLSKAAREYGLDAVGELESRMSWEEFAGQSGDGLLEILEVSCVLRPDAEAIGITRTGALTDMQRGQALKVLSEGEFGLMAQAMTQNPDAVMEFLRDMREDKRFALLAHLEMAKAVTGAEGSEEHERAHAISELLVQIRNTLPGTTAATQLPSAGSVGVPRQLQEGRPRRRDKRARNRDGGAKDTAVNEDAGKGGASSRHDDD
ncbi:hypothetical protein [Streptomyces massasporeus]|uniref:hypothetical protein n=1 Tax=Streptomyces massasporeus TaxID=67324 RepID=UPI0036FD58E2